ncbi:MAG: c-type cytochrome biogenesis protein CcsB [Dehalococcoidia bacterium]
MAELAIAFFWLGVGLTAASTLCLVASAVGSRVVRRTAVTNAGTITLSETQPPAPLWGRLGSWLAVAAGVTLALMLVTRTIATGHPPYTNMFEYLSAFGAGVVIAAVIIERRSGGSRVGIFAMPLALALFLVADIAFSSEIQPLVPALQNNRLLAIHVAAMIVSYSVLGVAFVTAVLYLVQGNAERFSWLPSARTLDEVTYKAVVAGFPILGLGIALGAYWGNIAWGRYWGWDPKETTALVTWLVFAGYLHARSLAQWRGKRAAWLVITGFAVIIFNIFAVNFWIAGLHSYA